MTTCVSNGKAGNLDTGRNKNKKVPAGIPCTGWYLGKNTHTKGFCQGTGYGGNGWCGVEAPPGKTGKYSKADSAWAGCSKVCPPGGVAVCKCEHGVPLKGDACNKHDAPGCKSCKSGYKLNAKKTACVK